MTKLPIIRSIKPNTFNVGESLTADEIVNIKAYMWREFQIDWKAPGEVIQIESSREIVKIMQEKPIDRRGER